VPSPSSSTSILTFELDGTSSNTFTLTDATGQVLRTLQQTGFASGEQGDGAGLLLFGSHTFDQALAMIARDGTVAPIPSSVIGVIPPGATLLDSHRVLASVGDQNHAKLDLIDLTTGQVSTLLTVVATQQTGGLQPQSLVQLSTSADRSVAHVLVRHATVNGTSVPQWAVVDVDLARNVVSIRHVPVANGVDPYDALEPALSNDGRLLACEEGTTPDAQGNADYRTHMVDLASGHDTVIDHMPLAVSIDSRGLRLSPDGSVLVAYGYTWPSTGQSFTMTAFATANGHLLSRIDAGNALNNSIEPVGWIGNHTLAYTTNTSATGNFNGSTSVAHTFDAISGERYDLPAGVGLLVAVLN